MKSTTISVINPGGTGSLQTYRGFSALVAALLLVSCPVFAAGVIVRFDPASPDIGPFPTDALTIADAQQKTGRRMNLPLPDCQAQRSACQDSQAINELDGFSIAPRIRVRFSGPINADTSREGIFLVALMNLTNEEYGLAPAGAVIPLNQLIYDPETLSLYAKPDVVLDQHRRYALIVTTAVLDRAGDAVQPDPEFLRCLNAPPDSYCHELALLVQPIRALGERFGASQRIVAASVFTTMSATAWMEKARDLLPGFPGTTRPAGPRSIFDAQEVASIVLRNQNRLNPPGFADMPLRTDLLAGVGRIGFGSYHSPRFLNEQQLIPAVPTAVALEPPTQKEEIVFNSFLPSSPKPNSGYPVVIAGHSTGIGFAYYIAGAMAKAGYATLAINAVGNGFGPEGRLLITEKNGTITDLPARGRGVDVNRDGIIGGGEGCVGLGSFGSRDCLRQTALDLMQLVRAIRAGIDLDGDGIIDLDANRVYYIGHSFGAFAGTLFMAQEPNVSAAALAAGGATLADAYRWAPASRPGLFGLLSARVPPVLPNNGSNINDNYVLRDQPVKINDVAGAIEIQNILEQFDWIRMNGDPLAYAPHLRSSTLPGIPIKRVLFQFARADQTVANPANSALIRTANMREWSVLYRHDVARAAMPQLPADPHLFIFGWPGADLRISPAGAAIALAVLEQAAQFFAAAERCPLNEPCIADVNEIVRSVFGRNLFELIEVLPEDLGFVAP